MGLKDVQHVLWVACILLCVAGVALIVRARFVPPTFGQFGTYRGASVQEIRDTPVKYHGVESCKSCHEEQGKEWSQFAHKSVACESCHGPGMDHAKPDVDPRPKILGTRELMARSHDLCLSCHAKTPGRRADFPQVDCVKHVARYDVPRNDPGHKRLSTTGISAVSAQEPKVEASALPEEYSCMFCHGAEGTLAEDEDMQHLIVTEEHLAGDVHWQRGLQCHDCHGGSPTVDEFEDHRSDESFRSVASPDKIREFCGHCHFDVGTMRRYRPSPEIDELVEYLAGRHGRRLEENGDPKVATCVTCHGHHAIRAIDPLVTPDNCSPCHKGHVPLRERQSRESTGE